MGTLFFKSFCPSFLKKTVRFNLKRGRIWNPPLSMKDVLLVVGATTMFAFANLLRSASEVVVVRVGAK
jgi:hypothetical protein